MPVQHSPPAKNTRSQRHQDVLTSTERAPLDCTPSVHQLSANLERGPPMEGEVPSRRGGISQGPRSRSGAAEAEEGEESEETKVEVALAGAPEASEGPNLAPSNQPLVSQAEPNFLKMMEQMTQLMGKLTQEVSPRDTSKAPEFKTPSMNAPDSFDGTKAYRLKGFIQSYPSYLLKHWKLFETQLFTLFGDPNEVRKAEQELENLRMKEGGNVSFLQELMEITLELDTSNDFSTSFNRVDLVGELKTPPLPPSVHIPSIIPSHLLLPSIDEVFKEIKDVGEDVAIFSLNLFQGYMDLPPLSFHASLEEQWDEEEEPEEIETVLKVVPPAYHPYLDVFYNMKAKKLPPNHACDHHI
ncbi:hypothetical protein O181_063488 [Austropuccinia psidii MF-1]|uniref:Retrotransposon gag domain-containing protein n=1 Tax=Austropuccinia psidii MF-1 TaxID=1389203 RepID=A0A9Q3ELF5_9BASI|nr:hypothetical protein [Austropuccinia psidii MF-1]